MNPTIAWQKGAEFGYNKAKEDVKHDLMMKLKDEGIVKPLKDSILRNERLNSQEQQELCAWIECAMEFGENLDKCAKKLEEANKVNEWQYVNWEYFADKDYPESESALYLVRLRNKDTLICEWETEEGFGCFWDRNLEPIDNDDVIAWKEIVLPELPKEIEK